MSATAGMHCSAHALHEAFWNTPVSLPILRFGDLLVDHQVCSANQKQKFAWCTTISTLSHQIILTGIQCVKLASSFGKQDEVFS